MNQTNENAHNHGPVKRKKGGIDTTAPYCAEVTKTITNHSRSMDPKSFCLAANVGTYWDGTTANGVIHPDPARTSVALGITRNELPDIGHGMTETLSLEEMQAGAMPDWAIQTDDEGRILSYQPLFIGWVRANRALLKQERISINHIKAVTRYQKGLAAGLAKAMSILATALTPSDFNDLGFSSYPYGQAPHLIWHTDRRGKRRGTKMQHNAQFRHPLILDRSPAGAAELSKKRVLTEDDVAQSYQAVLTFGAISDKFLLGGDWQAILDAIDEVNAYGWHAVQIIERGDDKANWRAVFTPTLAFHQFVWDLDFIGAGPMLTRFEVENGFIPFEDGNETEGGDPMTTLPPLGYHYLYGIKSARTGAYITVGETAQALQNRLRQHERSGTNGDANEAILAILADPDDHLEIVHFATVHHSIASHKEMSLAHKMLDLGHGITNKILTVKENDRTVKLDTRFGSEDYIKRNWWAIQEKLDLQLETYGKEILFMIDKLPEAPTTDAAAAHDPYEDVRWLFEPNEFPDSPGIAIEDDEEYRLRMCEAEERETYDEFALYL